MKTLTKKERLEFYKKALENWLSPDNEYYGFCRFFTELIKDPLTHDIYFPRNFKKQFPELYSMKPKRLHMTGYWFDPDDYESRIECLKKAIELIDKENEAINKKTGN